ncbi:MULTISPECIES: hypothetical protein [Streptomyces]|uniref:hypothetical protein n=1 Tax=Streptomyces TaxID=1883 RepID=UPI002248E541|nr:hypothetical protein [Streptomyces sp. JHD 1]MCX2971152.1 hypothetical protein [Streptomyces sp. JHD 1]
MGDFTPRFRELVYDAETDSVGEFRGVAGPYWLLRSATGGAGWLADPARVCRADPIERLSAEVARANARSRGEVL